jgi:hypothetical protein
MDFTEFGMIIDINDEHSQKQYSSMEITEFGIKIDVNDIHPRKLPS